MMMYVKTLFSILSTSPSLFNNIKVASKHINRKTTDVACCATDHDVLYHNPCAAYASFYHQSFLCSILYHKKGTAA